jgi:hypothetical protein
MSEFIPKNTLAYYDALPQTKLISVAHIPAKNLAINCRAYLDGCGTPHPETEALSFYALNHLASIVRKKFTAHEALPDWAEQVMRMYAEALAKSGQRALIYLALITTREVRHTQKSSEENIKAHLDKEFGKEVWKYINKLRPFKGNSTGAVNHFMDTPPDLTLGQWFSGVTYAFNNGSYQNGYGGVKWGKVAEPLEAFIHGKISLEMLLDTVWTLAHNGGPIFNKGMCYDHYGTELIRILDVQRSGQIPEMVMYDWAGQQYSDYTLKHLVTKVRGVCPEEFGPEVDWHLVEALGSIGSYGKEKQAQKNKPQPKPVIIEGMEKIGEYKVAPGIAVPILSRKGVAA